VSLRSAHRQHVGLGTPPSGVPMVTGPFRTAEPTGRTAQQKGEVMAVGFGPRRGTYVDVTTTETLPLP